MPWRCSVEKIAMPTRTPAQTREVTECVTTRPPVINVASPIWNGPRAYRRADVAGADASQREDEHPDEDRQREGLVGELGVEEEPGRVQRVHDRGDCGRLRGPGGVADEDVHAGEQRDVGHAGDDERCDPQT